jgi:hypothetical protein
VIQLEAAKVGRKLAPLTTPLMIGLRDAALVFVSVKLAAPAPATLAVTV